MGPSTRNPSLGRGLACTPQVSMHAAGWWRLGGWDPQAGASDPGCCFAGSLSSRFSEPTVDQGPGAGIPSALVLISAV